ncbi:hypothetical protein C8J57DRAFT_1258767 [Mycena rebaudengoi]|nr:hypothetical protein C8J57DRAFT_1258767 [Mycena rebaudengoi]
MSCLENRNPRGLLIQLEVATSAPPPPPPISERLDGEPEGKAIGTKVTGYSRFLGADGERNIFKGGCPKVSHSLRNTLIHISSSDIRIDEAPRYFCSASPVAVPVEGTYSTSNLGGLPEKPETAVDKALATKLLDILENYRLTM